MKKKNARIFSLTVSVFFALFIVGSLLSVGGGIARAATSSTTHPSACTPNNYQYHYGYIYDLRGTGTYLGELEIITNGCADANAWIFPAQSYYHVNHLWIRDAGNNDVSWDAGGGGTGSTDTGWWGVQSSCAKSVGVIQYGNMWGNGSTVCWHVN